MRYLLDINVLIALIDPAHVQHDRAHEWFAAKVGHPRYPNSPGSPAAVAGLLASFRQLPGHAFWPGDVSLLDREHVNAARLLDSAHVTDSYLLALARKHDGKLASFDQRLVTDAVVDGHQAFHLIR
ncbi:MAG: VapC toxin family PIN domain ribonuclease [Acidobacteria bacterium]|nr:MAG: VapC toxin family PIN domain ribonuclease [Acidobacteriota bacterium]